MLLAASNVFQGLLLNYLLNTICNSYHSSVPIILFYIASFAISMETDNSILDHVTLLDHVTHSPGQSHLLSAGYPPKLSMPFSTKHCFYVQLSLVALCDNFGFLDKANLSIFATSFNSVSFEEFKLSKLLQNQQPL